MNFLTFHDGAIVQVAPLHQSQLTQYAADSARALRAYRIRRALRLGLASLGNIMLWSILLISAPFLATHAYA